jgi:5-formyltetrahydrofolate cyclo-ligase
VSSHQDPRPSKETLRADLRDRISAQTPDAASAAAARVTERVLALPEVVEATGVLACLSFGGELDTWTLVQRLQTPSRRVLVPRADPADRQLHVHAYPCELRELSFGLRQPPRGAPQIPDDGVAEAVDVVLILGLGFDSRGYRLGYGSGYFDRFLAKRDLFAVGLAFEVQMVDRIPNEPYDIPMSVVVTEDAVRRCARPSEGLAD